MVMERHYDNWCLFKDIPCYLKPTDECEGCIQYWTLPDRQKEAVMAFLLAQRSLLKSLEAKAL